MLRLAFNLANFKLIDKSLSHWYDSLYNYRAESFLRPSRNTREASQAHLSSISTRFKKYAFQFLVFSMHSIAWLARTLALLFLIPLRIIWPLIKGLILDLLLLLYRLYRVFKKALRKVASPETESQRTWLVTGFLVTLSLLIVVSNVQAKTSVRDFGNLSMVAQLLDPIAELTVVEAEDAAIAPSATASSTPQLLAALETGQESSIDNLSATNTPEIIIEPVADISGALAKNSMLDTSRGRRGTIIHTVKPSENAGSIAEKYGLYTSTILWANNLNPHSIIRPGDDLKIPTTNGVLHKIKKNETLSGLAAKYEIEIDKIMAANRLVSANQIGIGDELIIPGARIAYPVANTRLGSVRQIFNPNPAKVSNSGFIWPTPSRRITQYYWLRHRAIDVGHGGGSLAIIASKAGIVSFSGWSRGYGINVVIDHGAGVKTRYAHLSRSFVTRGERVAQGEQIGNMGTTGRSTGVHLHFEIIDNGRFLNPLSYL